MFERENREDRSRPRSLLARGPDARAQRPPSVSLLSVADAVKPSGREDAVERHRLARAQREAQSEAAQRRQFDDARSPGPEADSFHEPLAYDPTVDPEESLACSNPIEALRAAIKRAVSRKAPDHDAIYQEIDQHSHDESFAEENLDGFDDAPVFAPDAAMPPTEDPMYHPVYPDPNTLYAPQPMGFAQPQHYAQQPYPQAPQYYPVAPHMMPQQMAPYPAPQMQTYAQPYAPPQPYPYAQPPQQPMAYPQQAQAWQMQPPLVYPYAPPMPPQAYAQPFNQQPSPEMQAMPAPAEETMPIEEIRASLREFRDAVRDLADSRSRRRYF